MTDSEEKFYTLEGDTILFVSHFCCTIIFSYNLIGRFFLLFDRLCVGCLYLWNIYMLISCELRALWIPLIKHDEGSVLLHAV